MTDHSPADPVREPAAAAFAEAVSQPSFLFRTPPAEGREAVDDVQSGAVEKPDADEEWATVPVASSGAVGVDRPAGGFRG